MIAVAQWGSVAFSLASAACWFMSALVKVRLFGIAPIGGPTHIHGGESQRRQSRWNTAAAATAGVAAVCMAISTALCPCR